MTNKAVVRSFRRALKHYNPEKGLKTIAVAEAAEKHFARAKDTEKLYQAVETKLRAQAEFILWWDGQAKHHYGKGSRNSTVTTKAGKDGIPERMVLHRWRKLLDEAKLVRLLEEAQERCRRICEQEQLTTIRGTEGTGEFERYTPPEYVEAARKVLGKIDLDPASNEQAQKTIKAKKFFTEKDNGLQQEWHGNVFLNPPYHRDLAPQFINKLVQELKADHVKSAVLLTNNSTDTDWFDRAVRSCAGICFTHGRIKFTTPKKDEVLPTQGQAFFYFGHELKRFEEVFCTIGPCMRPSRQYGQT